MISKDDIRFAIVQSDIMNYEHKGINGFSEAITGFSAVACVYPDVCHIIATEASGIKTVSDLKGKNVAIGEAGSSDFYTAVQVLDYAGINYNTAINATYVSLGNCSERIKNGTVDAAFITSNISSTAIAELASNIKVVTVEIEDALIAKLISLYSFYTKYEMTKTDCTFIVQAVSTVALMSTFIVDD